ncbi:MAG: DNA mismatch repair endonuclease MutL [Saprospiraceae bacterium]
MPDIIQLLPDSIANQIAAGEVIQRPASVIKELLENAIDAGSTSIRLVIKDAGKTSIQVIDDGKGMSETDVRMAFERHATSKIRSANDLFCIKTMGFRGEALASIAAIAHVEMISRQSHEDLANKISIEGSEVVRQEKTQSMPGTSITVKNLFYNVPARRKFLKSDPVELRHIMDEFHRVALSHADIHFTFHHNGNEIYHLPKGNLKQRIVGVIGKNINDKLMPVQEETEVATFGGFIGKPDAARKTQGDQFIFVNKRYIKSNYLNHAIRAAYEDMITKDVFPAYFLFLDIDPANIDINVHPTKTEIKFEDERLIYNYLRVTLKHSLGQYSIIPMLDFNIDQNFALNLQRAEPPNPSSKGVEKDHYSYSIESEARFRPGQESARGWEDVYKSIASTPSSDKATGHPLVQTIESEAFSIPDVEKKDGLHTEIKEPSQFHQTYIIHQVKSGIMMIDQQAAHERIMYERYLDILQNGESSIQKELFPRTIELNPAQSSVLKNILPNINALGFEIENFGQDTYIIHGTPAGLHNNISIDELIEKIIAQYIQNLEFELGIEENLARSMAISAGVKRGKKLEKEEMNAMINQLFACALPYKSPSGKNCFIVIEHDELTKRFNQ